MAATLPLWAAIVYLRIRVLGLGFRVWRFMVVFCHITDDVTVVGQISRLWFRV